MSPARRHATHGLSPVTRPPRETVFVFALALVASIVVGASLAGGFPPRLGKSSDLELSGDVSGGAARAVVSPAPHAARHQTSTARQRRPVAAGRRTHHAKRSPPRRHATRRKPAARRTRPARAPATRSPQPTAVVRRPPVAAAPRTTPAPSRPTVQTAPVRSAPVKQPAPPVTFNDTGTSPGSDGGAVQFDDSGSGSAPVP